MTKKNLWTIVKPGGPQGPYWGVVAQNGLVIASQISARKHAALLATAKNIGEGDFDTEHRVGSALRDIMNRDLENPERFRGTQDYMVRAVVEAMGMVAKDV